MSVSAPSRTRPAPAGAGAGAMFDSHRASGRRRAVATMAVLAAVALALCVTTMMVGSYPLSAWQVLASLLHLGGDSQVDFIVRELRLPTALTALAAGLALGVAGAVFQRMLSNPLASPDFVGVSAGASLFAVGAIVLFSVSSLAISAAAFVGAAVSASLIYVLAWRDGITGYRFILIGIGVSELMYALIGYLLVQARFTDARAAMTWLVGSVGQTDTAQLWILVVAVAILLPLAFMLGRPLRMLELGDDTATGLGVRAEPMRLALIAVSLLLIAVATAAVGPIMFVALMAGPIASRLLRGGPGVIPCAALVGAIIVLAADLIAVHALPVRLPTGVITGAVGAPYLLWLLATTNREGRGG